MKHLSETHYITNATLLIPHMSEDGGNSAAFLESEGLRVGVIVGRGRERRSVEHSKGRSREFYARHTACTPGDHKTQERCSRAGCAD